MHVKKSWFDVFIKKLEFGRTCSIIRKSTFFSPALLPMSLGGKYVPPMNGRRSGVSHTLIGQPPPPLVAWQHADKCFYASLKSYCTNNTFHKYKPAQRSCKLCQRRASPLCPPLCTQSSRWGFFRSPHLQTTPSPSRDTSDMWNTPLKTVTENVKHRLIIQEYTVTVLPDRKMGLSSFFALSKASWPHGYLLKNKTPQWWSNMSNFCEMLQICRLKGQKQVQGLCSKENQKIP